MPDIEIKRGYEVLPDNNVRFGIKVINNSEFLIVDVDVDVILYRVQTSIDAAMDTTAMLVRDIGIDVSGDYNNIEIIEGELA